MYLTKFSLKPLMAVAMLFPFAASADEQYGLILPGIAGNETIAGFSDLIPLESFAIGVSPFTLKPSTLFIDKRLDATTPLLVHAVATEQHFGSAELYVFDSSGKAPPELSLMYTFSNLFAQTHTFGGPTEAVSFEFSKYAYTIFPVSPPPVSAPELDVSTAASEATLLVGGLFILCARRPREDKSAHIALV